MHPMRVELILHKGNRILSPARLPIPPRMHRIVTFGHSNSGYSLISLLIFTLSTAKKNNHTTVNRLNVPLTQILRTSPHIVGSGQPILASVIAVFIIYWEV